MSKKDVDSKGPKDKGASHEMKGSVGPAAESIRRPAHDSGGDA